MNCFDRPARTPAPDPLMIEGLLSAVRIDFYSTRADPRDFHSDRRMLLYALCWPATWLDRRGLVCSPERYRSLLAGQLHRIRAYGDPACYSAYFPAYLLKCLQDYFQRHGEQLYGELKHIRNALDQVLASARFAARVRQDAGHLDLLVRTHRLLHAHRTARLRKAATRQLDLF